MYRIKILYKHHRKFTQNKLRLKTEARDHSLRIYMNDQPKMSAEVTFDIRCVANVSKCVI